MTAEFPGMDFGKLTMNKGELKIALRDQLCLHSKFDASLGLQALSSRCCEEAIDRYRDHRLAAAGWFLDVTGSEAPRARSQRRHHPVVLPAVNAMDRYAATCESEAKLLGMLRNVANVRAACFSLSVKMYGVYTQIDPRELTDRTRDWPNAASALGDGGSSRERSSGSSSDPAPYVAPSARGIEDAEKDVIVALRGAVFPAHEENAVRLLFAYLSLARLQRTELGSLDLNGDAWERPIARVAEALLKASLHVAIRWRGPWWKLVAVCSLMGFKEAYGNPRGDSCGEQKVDPADRDLIELFEELKPGQLTAKDLLELECSLRRDCPVHEVVLGTSKVRRSLRALLPETCLACRARKAPRAQARKRQGKKRDRVRGGPVEPTDDDGKLSLYCYETV